ncbi:MAG: SIS domain-containing protein [Chloroflexota bacterium]|nr:SIS domain-containing protein [Chloroflexota bacterium]
MPDFIDEGRRVIEHEAQALAALAGQLGEEFERAAQLISSCSGRTIVTGVGKSGIVGRKIAASLASLGTPAFFVHAAEAVHGDLGMITSNDVVIALSNSGETAEVVHVAPLMRRGAAALIAITSRPNSTLARLADVHLDIGVREEADRRGLAPTTSAIATMALGDALALALAEARSFTREQFHAYHPGGSLGKQLQEEQDHG